MNDETTAHAAAAAALAAKIPGLLPILTDNVTVITPTDRVPLPSPPGAGFRRQACVEAGGVWAGFVTTEPGTASPWHHHGDHTTYVLMLSGEGVVELGGEGGERVPLRTDGTLYVVPPGLVHREINTSAAPNQAFILRVGSGPAVVPVEAPANAE